MMFIRRWLSRFKTPNNITPPSACVAKDRLQIIVSHQRAQRGQTKPEYLDALEAALIDTIRKHIAVDDSAVMVNLRNSVEGDKLELNIDLPSRVTLSNRA